MITNEEISKKTEELNNLILTKWLKQEFLTFEWFFTVFIVIACYFLFFYLVDKKRIVEILLYGSFVAVAFVVYDSVGSFFGLWEDHISISPFYPNVFGGSFTIAPLLAMLIYQYKTPLDRFLRWSILFSVIYIIGYFGYLTSNMGIFVYAKPYAKIIDLCCFFFCSYYLSWSYGLIVEKRSTKCKYKREACIIKTYIRTGSRRY